jgi:hypothetical protein
MPVFELHASATPASSRRGTDRPSGCGEALFIEAGRPAEHDGLPPAAPLDIERLKRVGERFGTEILGPPMAPVGR